MSRRGIPGVAAVLLAACVPFSGVHRELLLAALPDADCAERVVAARSAGPVERRAWRGDPYLTALGATGPLGRGERITWQAPDGAPVELWLLDTPDGLRLLQIRDSAPPDAAAAAATRAAMRAVEQALRAECGMAVPGGGDEDAALRRAVPPGTRGS